MIGPGRWLLVASVLALVGPAPGCGSAGDNGAVFAGGGGKPDPDAPKSQGEYDLTASPASSST